VVEEEWTVEYYCTYFDIEGRHIDCIHRPLVLEEGIRVALLADTHFEVDSLAVVGSRSAEEGTQAAEGTQFEADSQVGVDSLAEEGIQVVVAGTPY
jgi:hypothetical protein